MLRYALMKTYEHREKQSVAFGKIILSMLLLVKR